MELHQLQVTYHAEQDRLLYRASCKAEDGSLHEVRAWLTRRMVKRLWSRMLDALTTQTTLDKPEAAHVSADIVGMEHHALVEEIRDNGRFSNTYDATAQVYPLGETPILVTTVDFTLKANQSMRINMRPKQGPGFEMAFTLSILHGFCSLLKDAVAKAEWDMVLVMPGGVFQMQGGC